jgi:biopolymer transport protein ExbB/TolQ
MGINVILEIYQTYRNEKKYYVLQKSENFITKYLQYIVGQLFYIGLLGTVIGMGHMFKSIQNIKDVDQVLKIVSEGGLTLFNTTIIALFSYLWTRFNSFIGNGE